LLEGGKIDGRQAVYLSITYIVATTLLGVAAITTSFARHDAWISSILATVLSIPVAWLVVKLSSLFPGKTFIEYQEEILGKYLGKITGLIYVVFFIHICSVMIREFGDFIMAAFFEDTPILVFHIIVVAMGAYTVRHGLEVLARVNQIFLPFIILSVVIIIFLTIPELDFKRLLPVLDTSPVNIIKGSITPLAWHSEILALAMIIPFLTKPDESGKIAYKSLAMVGFIFLIVTAGSIATFGELVAFMSYPFLNTARIINIAKFIDRLDPLIMVIWLAGGFVKITFFYYIAVLGSAQLFKLNSYRPLVLPIGIILVAMAVAVGENSIQIAHFLSHIFPVYGTFFQAAIPFLLLVIALFRKQGRTPK